jgi:hypothetical protein
MTQPDTTAGITYVIPCGGAKLNHAAPAPNWTPPPVSAPPAS